MNRIVFAAIAATTMLASSAALAGPVFGTGSYSRSLTLAATPVDNDTTVSVAFDGTNYFAAFGGFSQSPISMFSTSGTLLASTSPNPGIDFRSVFTDTSGALYARGFNNATIYKQTSFGEFSSFVTLSGLNNLQEAVLLNAAGDGYVGNDDGTLQFWDLSGALTGTQALQAPSNSSYPANRTVSVYGDYYLNYFEGTLSAYDASGALVDQTLLNGADQSFNSSFAQSYANGYFFLGKADGSFDGYALNAVPEPAAWGLMLVGFGAVGAAMRRRTRTSVRFA